MRKSSIVVKSLAVASLVLTALVFVPVSSQALEVIWGGNTATGIIDLECADGVFIDVTFVFDVGTAVYGPHPGEFPYEALNGATREEGTFALGACIQDALNAWSVAITRVGPQSKPYFLIAGEDDQEEPGTPWFYATFESRYYDTFNEGIQRPPQTWVPADNIFINIEVFPEEEEFDPIDFTYEGLPFGARIVPDDVQYSWAKIEQAGGSPSPPPVDIGGSVTGLEGIGLVLQNNGADDEAISADGAFTFNNTVPAGSSYAVTVKTQPRNPTQKCTVARGSGTAQTGGVDDVLVTCAAALAVESVVTGDLDGDGDDDLAGVPASALIRYTTDLTTWTNIQGNLQSIVTGDLNGDGNDDIAGLSSTGLIYYTTDLSTWNIINGPFTAIATGDLDGDGDDDIAGINPDGVSAKVFYTTDLSTFTPIPGVITSIATGDLDGDGDDDIAGINPDGVSAKVFYTTDLSTWTPIPGLIKSIVTGDFDGDGNDDIAGINPDGVSFKVFYTTDLTTWIGIPGLITSIVAGNFDGDADDDIAGINPDGVAAKIFYTTDLSTWITIPGELDQIASGDLNDDGTDDLAGVNRTTGLTWYTIDLSTWTSIP